MKFQAFLSHNSADKSAVEELARRLEETGISTFLDKWHLIPGEPWQPALEEALDQSATCVVFVGRSGLGPWQNEEMRAAVARRVADGSRNFRVVPVLLPGAQREQRSKLPKFLVAATWVEFSGTIDDRDSFHRLKCGILGQSPGPSSGGTLDKGICPYRGLQAFDVADARFFFGRDNQVDWMIERLQEAFGTVQESRFLGVVGASGSGKSSLVRAGLIPAIQTGGSRSGKALPGSVDWPVVILRPGSEPLKSLADALWSDTISKSAIPDPLAFADQLARDERRLHATIGTVLTGSSEDRRFVIVVDQFEELFTQCPTETEEQRRAFIDNLLYAASIRGGRTLVLITMRADFYGKCSRYEQLAHALADDQELVPPLSEAHLRMAIELPAQRCGIELEQGLVELLLQDMREQPAGALPLLQQTLYMLWERRQGYRLTVQAYRDIGEIEGALEAHANRIYSEQLKTDEQRDICRRVLLMLTTPGEGTEDTRRRVSRSQLGVSAATDAVLQELVKGRLITVSKTDPPQVEVTHEALIRGWHALREWLDEDREALRILQRLADAAEEWESNNHDPAFIYSGSRLAQATAWTEDHAADLVDLPSAQTFLNACVSHRDQAAQASAAQKRRLRRLALALAATLLFAGLVAICLQVQGHRRTGLKLVEALPEMQTSSVRNFVDGLEPYSPSVDSRLVTMFEQSQDPKERLHAAMTLHIFDPAEERYREFLVERMLQPELLSDVPLKHEPQPDDLRAIRDVLATTLGIPDEVDAHIQAIVGRQKDMELNYVELNAAGALSGIKPGDERWKQLGPLVAEKLSREPFLRVERWSVVFAAVAEPLRTPLLNIYGDETREEQQRTAAYMLLFRYANPDRPDDFVDLIADANLTQFRELMSKIESHQASAVSRLVAKLESPARFDEKLARRQCRVAIALWLLGDFSSVSTVLQYSDDPTLRTELIHEFVNFGVDVDLVIEQLNAEQDLPVRCALIMALGEYPQSEFQPAAGLIQTLLDSYRDPKPELHGSVEWLLREKWGRSDDLQAIDNSMSCRDPDKDRDWYVNRQGQTFTVVRNPAPFQMGSASGNEKPQHWRHIGRTFAIATKEVTVTQYKRFVDANLHRVGEVKDGKDLRDIFNDPEVKRYISNKGVLIDDAPMIAVTWYEAAQYCNWLSEQEGIEKEQWCFEPNTKGLYASDMSLTTKDHSRTGYRLPTEAEWEYACRAGSLTSYPHGLIANRLGSYAQYVDNDNYRLTFWTVGQKMPNDLGLFDMLGSSAEWVNDAFANSYPAGGATNVDPVTDVATTTEVLDGTEHPRVRRGGILPLAPHLRPTGRSGNRPDGQSQAVGFRVARTIPSP